MVMAFDGNPIEPNPKSGSMDPVQDGESFWATPSHLCSRRPVGRWNSWSWQIFPAGTWSRRFDEGTENGFYLERADWVR